MPSAEAAPIRLELNLGSNPPLQALDRLTGAPPKMWKGSDTQMAFGIFDSNGFAVDLSNLLFLEADICESPDRAWCPLVSSTLAQADIEDDVTYEDWVAGINQQGIFSFLAEEMECLRIESRYGRKFWLSIKGQTQDGGIVPYAGDWVTIFDGVTAQFVLPPNSIIPGTPSLVPAGSIWKVGCKNTNFYTPNLDVEGRLEVCGLLIENT